MATDCIILVGPSQDTRLREAGAKVVCCLTRGAPKGPNLPRVQLNHQDALFPGHGLATHNQTWDTRLREAGAEVVYCLAQGAPKGPNLPRARLNHQDALFPGHGKATHSQTWAGEPAWLGVRGDATLQTPAFTGTDDSAPEGTRSSSEGGTLSSIISSTDCWLAVEYASSSWLAFRELDEAGVGKALPRPEERADDEGVRSSSLEEDSRLQEAGAKVVCCLARGAPKGPNLPRAQLNHQDALFPGHGLATHSQTWDRTSSDGQRGVVYKVQCGDCDATYIGETGRKRATRLKEHKRDVAKATHATRSKTELVEHCWTTGHTFDLDNATTLAREQRWGQRKFVESWCIRRDSSVCNTNRGPLPDVYGDVCDK
ncbi:hypothetical protein ISCGN_027242 [Ixodes scapularis]